MIFTNTHEGHVGPAMDQGRYISVSTYIAHQCMTEKADCEIVVQLWMLLCEIFVLFSGHD